MAKLPNSYKSNFYDSPANSPAVSDDELAPLPPQQPVTQTVSHPYKYPQVRMRKKGVRTGREEEAQPSADAGKNMLSLQAELNSTKTELKRQTVLFSTHYSEIVEKWKNEKNKREVAETVAVEKAKEYVVLKRTQKTLAKQSAEGILSRPGGEGGEEEGEGKLVELTQENEKLRLENQDLNETVKLMEEQIAQFKQNAEDQSASIQQLKSTLGEMELESLQSKSYMLSAQQQYKNLAGRLHDEKEKREIAESVAVNKARELEVQKRTSIMVMSSLSSSVSSDLLAPNSPNAPLMDAVENAGKISSLEAEIEDLKESRQVLEGALERYEQESALKDEQIRELREKLFLGSLTDTLVEEGTETTHSLAIRGSPRDNNDFLLSTETVGPLLLQSYSTGAGDGFSPGNFPRHATSVGMASTLDRPRRMKGKVSAAQSTEQLQQEIKRKEATISIMKEKLGRMKLEGSKADLDLEVERRELEDQVGGLDKKLSTFNTGDGQAETEVDELREKLESVERKAADFEEKSRYYQELLNKMNPASEPSLASLPLETPVSPADIPLPPPNIPPPPPPPLPEGLFGPATPQFALPRPKRSSQAQQGDNRGQAMSELMTVLNSGKVNLKKAITRAPTKKESESQSEAPVLFTHLLRRQITEPGSSSPAQQDPPPVVFRSINLQTIETKLRQTKQLKDSDGKWVSSELASKLDRRRQVSEKTSSLVQPQELAKSDSSPLPPAGLSPESEHSSKPTAVRKVTPVPPATNRSQSLRKQTEPILEEPEEPVGTPPDNPPKQFEFSPVTDDPSLSPFKRQDSPVTSPAKPPIPREKKPSFKSPLLPPTTREFVPIQAIPSPDEKRAKSGSSPNLPASPRSSKRFGFFKKEAKSPEHQQRKESRSATDGDIDSTGVDSIEPSTGKGPQKLKIPQIFSKK